MHERLDMKDRFKQVSSYFLAT